VLGIVAAFNIPLVHFSVIWWRTLHQPPSLMKPSPGMPRVIVIPLLVNFVAFSLLYIYFVAKRVRLLQREAEAAA
jgi:heme exporter protein C